MKKCVVCIPPVDEMREIFTAINMTVKDILGSQWACIRANDPSRPGMIDERFIQRLLNADLVIAVIAGPKETIAINPNVMYELGIAHSFRKPTIVVADSSRIKLPPDTVAENLLLIDFSSSDATLKLKTALQNSFQDSRVIDELERKRIPRNPIITQLSGTHIFIEDFPWVLGYADVLKRERAATTVWEITSDLFWAGEPVFFASITESIRLRRKHYFLIAEDAGVLRTAEAIKDELHAEGFTKGTINEFVHFAAVERGYFWLIPTAIALYDANLPARRRGLICEPMQFQVDNDSCWHFRSEPFSRYGHDLAAFEKCLLDLDWTDRRREATFDIALDDRIVEKLATSFAQLWNEEILEEAQSIGGNERSILLNDWLIGARS